MRLGRKRVPVVTPQALLDAAYAERVRATESIRIAADAVHASRARLEAARRTWAAAVARNEMQARSALESGEEARAKSLAYLCIPIEADISAADAQLERYRETETDLAAGQAFITEQLESLRRRRDATRGTATTAAALAQVRAELAALETGFERAARAIEPPR